MRTILHLASAPIISYLRSVKGRCGRARVAALKDEPYQRHILAKDSILALRYLVADGSMNPLGSPDVRPQPTAVTKRLGLVHCQDQCPLYKTRKEQKNKIRHFPKASVEAAMEKPIGHVRECV
jgi:hypothetical protein